jgi:hypothetical protein
MEQDIDEGGLMRFLFRVDSRLRGNDRRIRGYRNDQDNPRMIV